MAEHSTVEDRNTDLFFDIADAIEFFPDTYDQGTWGDFRPEHEDYVNFEKQFGYDPRENGAEGDDPHWLQADVDCNTVHCVAGHAVALKGWHPTIVTMVNTGETYLQWGIVAERRNKSHKEGRDVTEVARTLLGITNGEASWLFKTGTVLTPDMLRKFGKGTRILPVDHE